MLQKFFIPFLIAFIALLSVWISRDEEDIAPQVLNVDQNVPEFYMENFTTQVLDKGGAPQYILQAAHMAHYPHDNHADLQEPILTVYEENKQAHWQVIAASGVLDNNRQQIQLHGEVNIDKSLAQDDMNQLHIITRDLLVLPPTFYAETSAQTLITQGDTRVETKGMKAFFNEDRIQLLSQVRGVYESRP